MQSKPGSKVKLCSMDAERFAYKTKIENFQRNIAKDVETNNIVPTEISKKYLWSRNIFPNIFT